MLHSIIIVICHLVADTHEHEPTDSKPSVQTMRLSQIIFSSLYVFFFYISWILSPSHHHHHSLFSPSSIRLLLKSHHLFVTTKRIHKTSSSHDAKLSRSLLSGHNHRWFCHGLPGLASYPCLVFWSPRPHHLRSDTPFATSFTSGSSHLLFSQR